MIWPIRKSCSNNFISIGRWFIEIEQALLPHLDAAYNLARWLTRNEHDAEDVVQEAYLRALKFFGGFHAADGRAWLLAIVRDTCYTWLQQKRTRGPATTFDERIHGLDADAVSPEQLLLREEDKQSVRRAVEALPAQFREVVVLRELEGLSYKEIATIADIPCGTVMSRLARARERLRHQLARVRARKPRTVTAAERRQRLVVSRSETGAPCSSFSSSCSEMVYARSSPSGATRTSCSALFFLAAKAPLSRRGPADYLPRGLDSPRAPSQIDHEVPPARPRSLYPEGAGPHVAAVIMVGLPLPLVLIIDFIEQQHVRRVTSYVSPRRPAQRRGRILCASVPLSPHFVADPLSAPPQYATQSIILAVSLPQRTAFPLHRKIATPRVGVEKRCILLNSKPLSRGTSVESARFQQRVVAHRLPSDPGQLVSHSSSAGGQQAAGHKVFPKSRNNYPDSRV